MAQREQQRQSRGPEDDQDAISREKKWFHPERMTDLDGIQRQPSETGNQLRELHGLTISPPLGEFIISSILQLLALGIAIAFGVYAVKSVAVANQANRYAVEALAEAKLANQIAMLSICAATDASSGNIPEFCRQLGSVEPDAFSAEATQFLVPATSASSAVSQSSSSPSSASSTSSTTSSASVTETGSSTAAVPTSSNSANSSSSAGPSSPRLSAGAIAGIVVGGVSAAGLLLASGILFLRKRQFKQQEPWGFLGRRRPNTLVSRHTIERYHSPPPPSQSEPQEPATQSPPRTGISNPEDACPGVEDAVASIADGHDHSPHQRPVDATSLASDPDLYPWFSPGRRHSTSDEQRTSSQTSIAVQGPLSSTHTVPSRPPTPLSFPSSRHPSLIFPLADMNAMALQSISQAELEPRPVLITRPTTSLHSSSPEPVKLKKRVGPSRRRPLVVTSATAAPDRPYGRDDGTPSNERIGGWFRRWFLESRIQGV